ncbi:MAG: hypothetical protein RLZ98_3171, partial [Pseudomonadota bacterium]
KSRGTIKLRSADPFDKVRIRGNFLSVEDDIRTMRNGIRFARELMQQNCLKEFRGHELTPGRKIESDADLDSWIRRTAVTVHHPAGTCAMGTDDTSVVGLDLCVHGTERLRVVDASVMPDLVSGNINACVVMIAERASDLIRGRPLLAAAKVSSMGGVS